MKRGVNWFSAHSVVVGVEPEWYLKLSTLKTSPDCVVVPSALTQRGVAPESPEGITLREHHVTVTHFLLNIRAIYEIMHYK